MRYTNLSRADLNLLVSFQVLIEERSVTGAAKRMFLSQPAMSRVLDRLRDLFKDPLLLRTGRGYEATRRALHIYSELEKLLPGIETVISGDKFDPATATDHFRIAMTDNTALSLLPKIAKHVTRLSPGIRIEVLAWKGDAFRKLESNALDLAIWIDSAPYPLRSETIYHDKLVCLVRRGHPLGNRRLSIRRYLALQHVVVDLSDMKQTRLDAALDNLGYHRSARLTVPFFAALAPVVQHTDLIATLPNSLAKHSAQHSNTRIVPLPIKLPKMSYIQVWHPRNDHSLPHQWFRGLVKKASAAD